MSTTITITPTDEILHHCRRRGYPAPTPEYQFAWPLRDWRFDLAWPDLMIAIEIDGAVFVGGRHTRGVGYEADCEKLNEAMLRGWRVLRVTPGLVRSRSALGWIDRLMGQVR